MANVLNLDDRRVFEVDMTADQVRALFDGNDLPDDVTTALDNAQGMVFTGELSKTFVVIKITK